MRNKEEIKAFTLIELMVVVLIVAVLAAVLIPLLTARLESARWSEGKSGAGTIATSIRAMAAEIGTEDGVTLPTDITDYCTEEDLDGKYFDYLDYSFTSDPVLNESRSTDAPWPATYTIRVTHPDDVNFPTVDYWELNHLGIWSRVMQ